MASSSPSTSSTIRSKEEEQRQPSLPERPVRRLFTPFLSKTVPPIPDKDERLPFPPSKVNWLSHIFMSWLVPLYNVGYKRTLTVNDLWTIPEDMKVETIYPVYISHIHSQQEKNEDRKFNVLTAIFKSFQNQLIIAFVLRCLCNTCQIVTPLLVKRLIMVVQLRVANPDNFPINAGIGYSLGIAILLIMNTLFQQHAFYHSRIVGAKARSVLTRHLLQKTTNATAKTRYEFPKGKVVSLMSADLAKLELCVSILPALISFPFPIIVGIALLIDTIGVSSLVGIGTLLFVIVLLLFPAQAVMKNRSLAAPLTDSRISLIREVLQSMKMIKFYSWEKPYEAKITEVRSKETYFILWAQNSINVILSLTVGVPSLSSMVTFLTLYGISRHSSHQRSVAEIFASLSLFSVISSFITNIPMLLSSTISGLISLKRLNEYLNAEEEEEEGEGGEGKGYDLITVSEPSEKAKLDNILLEEKYEEKSNEAIIITDGQFQWEDFTNTVTTDTSSSSSITKPDYSILQDINLTVPYGSFVVITGAIGSGKSSLLSAMNGDMKQLRGDSIVNGSRILCAEPWIQNITVRENILFGSSYDEKLYEKVIRACSLIDDLKLLTHGDLTVIGERGVTLSGGQKARINLARAVYKQKDIYLLDDVLSAIDANVGKSIVDLLFLDLLKGKTRVLATHQLSLVEVADTVVFMNGDGTIDVGTSRDLKQRNDRFNQLMAYHNQKSSGSSNEDENLEESKADEEITKPKLAVGGSLYETEESAINSIPLSLYKKYFRAGEGKFGPFIHLVIIASVSSTAFISMFVNVWLSFWVEKKFKDYSDGFYMGIYALLVGCFFLSLFVEVAAVGYVIVEASRRLNVKAIGKILHAPMSYMDTTPMGRILNRFAKDTNSMDNELAEQLKFFIHGTSMSIAVVILSIIYLPWFALAVPILVFVLVATGNYYQSSSREVKRLEAITRSFLYNQFNEVLSGLSTIKHYGHENRFLSLTDTLMDNLNEVYIVTVANQRWIQIVIDTIASLMIIIVTMLSLTGQFHISPASTGLICTMFIELSFLLSFALNAYAELENEMNSVERICHYAFDLEQEPAYTIPETKPDLSWPASGDIQFKNVSMRYREGLPLVLENLTIDVEGGEKIGICGRTGAGKSTLMTALYRLVEIADGEIIIDGVDISKIGLNDLRSKLSIIPQDPVLFQGTLRRNLDPFNERSDAELNDALMRSGLITPDETDQKFALDVEIEDGGANFSLGECQLIALTRAIVRKSKILIMDEATSSVDYKTDSLIQRTINTEFKDSTVLCIAHRLRTIIHYDKIVVLDKGVLNQFGKPLDLFEDGKGIFRGMCDSSKITRDDFVQQ